LTNATPQKINMGDVGNVPIPTPLDQGEQRKIATVLSDMDAEIAALETRLAKTQALKQGMMQALLTGRVRLV
jgi:type I restriction enzyme S subunit